MHSVHEGIKKAFYFRAFLFVFCSDRTIDYKNGDALFSGISIFLIKSKHDFWFFRKSKNCVIKKKCGTNYPNLIFRDIKNYIFVPD